MLLMLSFRHNKVKGLLPLPPPSSMWKNHSYWRRLFSLDHHYPRHGFALMNIKGPDYHWVLKDLLDRRFGLCQGFTIRYQSTETLDSTIKRNNNTEEAIEKNVRLNTSRNSSSHPSKQIARIISDADELLNKAVHTFQYPADYDRAYRLIHSVIHDTHNILNCAPAINRTIHLLERCVQEYSFYLQHSGDVSTDEKPKEKDLWFCNPFFYNGLLNRWKVAALSKKEDVLSPRDIVVKLQSMSSILPQRFRYNIVCFNIVMQVIIEAEPPEKAPMVAERLLNFIENESKSDVALQLNTYTQSLILQAWSESGLSIASQKIEQIMDRIHRTHSHPVLNEEICMVPYKIWIRYWASLGNVEKVESILSLIEQNEHLRSKLDCVIMSEVVYCYTKVGQIVKAEDMFDRIISMVVPSVEDVVIDDQNVGYSLKVEDRNLIALMESAHSMMNCYRRSVQGMIDKKNQRKEVASIRHKVEQTIERAEKIVGQMEACSDFDTRSVDRLRSSMMDIYAYVKRLDKLEMMFQKIDRPDLPVFGIMIKAYGKCQQPERSEEVVRLMIENPHYANPDIDTINCLVNAWSESASTHPNAAERALKVFQWIYDDPNIAPLKLRPTVFTYSTLLKCWALSSKGVRDAGEKILMILRNMESRYKSGDMSCRPDTALYTVAIKACLNANDYKRAESLLQLMEQRSALESSMECTVRPDVHTYSEFLLFYSKLGTASGAERATQIHDHMRKLSQTSDPSLKPNSYTYNMVLNAWAKSNDRTAADRIWNIYEQMINEDHTELSISNYTTLLVFFSKAKRPLDAQRAIHLLQAMQSNKDGVVQPLAKHYSMVMVACMNTEAVERAVDIMISFIGACVLGTCRLDDDISITKKYSWIFMNLLRTANLVGATRLISETLRLSTDKKDLAKLGIGFDSILKLLQAWETSNHVDKERYIALIDSEVVPLIW